MPVSVDAEDALGSRSESSWVASGRAAGSCCPSSPERVIWDGPPAPLPDLVHKLSLLHGMVDCRGLTPPPRLPEALGMLFCSSSALAGF